MAAAAPYVLGILGGDDSSPPGLLDLSNHQTIGFIGKSIGLRIAEASWTVFGFGMG